MNAGTVLAPLACLAALAGLGVGASVAQPRAGHVVALRAGSAPVDSVTLVCPAVVGTPAGLVTTMSVADLGSALPSVTGRADLRAVPLTIIEQSAGKKPTRGIAPKPFSLAARPVATVRKTTPYGAIAVTARGPGAARIAVDQVALQAQGLGRGMSDSACLPPGGDWWFAGGDGEVGYDAGLWLANPTDTLANVAVTAWSTSGELRLAGLDALTVPPRSAMDLKVASFAPNARDVAIRVHAASGSLVAALTERRIYGINPGGTDWVPPTAPPASEFVVAGLPAGDGSRQLQIANPGNRDASVGLRVMTRSGNFEPAGHQSIVVPAGHAVDVDLSSAIAGEPGAVVGTSDQPVIAEARMTAHARAQFDDTSWLPATPPMSGPAGLAASTPPFGQAVYLVLAAPRGAARVRIAAPTGQSAVVTAPAGRTVRIDLRTALHVTNVGALVFLPLDSDPVYAARVLYAKGTHGPLLTTEVPLPLPVPIVLPPAVEDPRAATR